MLNKHKKQGISLIVLVITIIIIIILAGAVILSLSNSNIIGKAKIAREGTDFTSIRQAVESEKTNSMFEGGTSDYKDVIPSSYRSDIMVTDNGMIFLKPNPDTKISDISNAIEKLGAAYMPAGFEYLEGTAETGIVIKNTTDLNEFVWVPVPTISEFYRVTDYVTFAETTSTQYKSYNEASATEKAEFTAMKASVDKYRGFYIARYEGGTDQGQEYGMPMDGSIKPLSQKNKTIWINEWDELSSDTTNVGNDTNNGAVKVARSMYPVNTATKIGMPVSTLIYGEQWDATMRFMREVVNPNITVIKTNLNVSGNKYITNSTGMGFFEDINTDFDENYVYDYFTGMNPAYAVKNIYDMAGNYDDWTMETYVYSLSGRVSRGGNYYSNITGASKRAGNVTFAQAGIRTALYIK